MGLGAGVLWHSPEEGFTKGEVYNDDEDELVSIAYGCNVCVVCGEENDEPVAGESVMNGTEWGYGSGVM